MGNLVLQVEAQYKEQITSANLRIDNLSKAISDKQHFIDQTSQTIALKQKDLAAAKTRYASAEAELSRLQNVRNQKKPNGCKRDIGYDNGCLDANTSGQNTQSNIMNQEVGRISSLSAEIKTLEDTKAKLLLERDKLTSDFNTSKDQLSQLNAAYNKSLAEAQASESAAQVASATAQNMPTQIQHQAEIDRQRIDAEIKLKQQQLDAERQSLALKTETEFKTTESKDKNYLIYAGIAGLVVIVIAVTVMIFAFRK